LPFGRKLLTSGEYTHTIYIRGDGMGVRNRLKEIRMREYMINSKEFAEIIDVLPDNYSRIENNKTQVSLERAILIAKKLGKSVEDIFEVE
jgi:DNA-binding XRE family transcriptional regulator